MVRRGQAWGSLIFASNYSESLFKRTEYGQNVEDSIIDSAMLDVRLDMSSENLKNYATTSTEIFIKFSIISRSTNWNSLIS